MNIVHALILAIVEGLTEFLPISSTGHLILVSHALGIGDTDFTKSFEIIIQLGAILAVVVLYFKTLLYKREYWPKLLVAFIPTALVGFTLYPLIKHVLLNNPLITLLSLLIGGIALIIIEKVHVEKETHTTDINHLTYRQAALIGCFQAISVIPGVSRAASTIIGGLLVGVKRTTAVEFSFLLAIPTMIAASGLDLIKSHSQFNSNEYITLLIGFMGAFVVALFAVKYFMQFIKKHNFVPFGIYRILLAVIYFLVFLR
ncbi:undecaprenyl-diphosphatase UppP [soil metagenome]